MPNRAQAAARVQTQTITSLPAPELRERILCMEEVDLKISLILPFPKVVQRRPMLQTPKNMGILILA